MIPERGRNLRAIKRGFTVKVNGDRRVREYPRQCSSFQASKDCPFHFSLAG